MELAFLIGMIILGLFAFLYSMYRFVGWALDINVPDGELRDPDE